MGFYGIVIASVALLSAFAVLGAQHNAVSYGKLSSAFAIYERYQYASALKNMLSPPVTAANSTALSNWAAALRASAKADQLELSINGNLLVLSDVQNDKVYAVVRLDNT